MLSLYCYNANVYFDLMVIIQMFAFLGGLKCHFMLSLDGYNAIVCFPLMVIMQMYAFLGCL